MNNYQKQDILNEYSKLKTLSTIIATIILALSFIMTCSCSYSNNANNNKEQSLTYQEESIKQCLIDTSFICKDDLENVDLEDFSRYLYLFDIDMNNPDYDLLLKIFDSYKRVKTIEADEANKEDYSYIFKKTDNTFSLENIPNIKVIAYQRNSENLMESVVADFSKNIVYASTDNSLNFSENDIGNTLNSESKSKIRSELWRSGIASWNKTYESNSKQNSTENYWLSIGIELENGESYNWTVKGLENNAPDLIYNFVEEFLSCLTY